MTKLEALKNDLKWRGLLKDIANEEKLEDILQDGAYFYVGIDPTSDSLHLGHYISIILAKILNQHGLKPIFIIGGFTGMIGDPSGKNVERELISQKDISDNVFALKTIINRLAYRLNILDYKIIDNNIWYQPMLLVEYFQKYGKLFNVNEMITKDSVKSRLSSGISYTEFSYQIFQAIDFYKLYQEHNVRLQLGGSDQWGNIVSGLKLIRKLEGDVAVSGMTINLITDKNGNKIGKTEKNPLWIDKDKLSSYFVYQYLINLEDDIAKNLLPQLTLITSEEFKKLEVDAKNNKKARLYQHELSKLIFNQIYSEHEYNHAHGISRKLFDEKFFALSRSEIHEIIGVIESYDSDNNKDSLIQFLIENKILKSKREVRELLKGKALKINGEIVADEMLTFHDYKPVHKKYFFLKLGKKRMIIIEVH